MKTTRCTTCRDEFTDAELVGASCCPSCGTTGVPCLIAQDVDLRINWHELRILGMWASNYAIEHCQEPSRRALSSILHSLSLQHPDLAEQLPLTMAGEIGNLRRAAESGELTGEPTTIESNVPDLLDE